MFFKRNVDKNYPRVYDTWKTEDATWIIQDLAPEDDEEAVNVLVSNLLTDEVLCSTLKLIEDPAAVEEACDVWRESLKQRMSLGCYVEKDGVRTLAGLNVCTVSYKGQEHHHDFKTKWRHVISVLTHLESKADCFAHLGADKVLDALGLVVRREYRGAKLGQKILAAREALSMSQGVTGTATVFTGKASQIPAKRNGFVEIAETNMKELAGMGLPYPADESKVIKYMVKKFDQNKMY